MLKFFDSKSEKIKPIVLLVLDGWGVAPDSQGNAITLAKTPNMDSYKSYPHGELIASGESVGLPANEAGNSEVGHLTIGAGRVVYQSLPRINIAIKEGTFYENQAFLAAAAHVIRYQSKFHIMGLVSSGTVHSSNEHLYALLEFCKRNKIAKVNVHLFTDGRDAPPDNGIKVVKEIEAKLEEIGVGQIASLCGRFYAMDRDGRWDRTKRAYDALVDGVGKKAVSAVEAMEASYKANQTDEFIEPTLITRSSSTANLGPHSQVTAGTIDNNDAVVFFNFRIDRPRQLTKAFTISNFDDAKKTFVRGRKLKNLFFVSMTEYEKGLPVSAIAYPPTKVQDTLGQLIANDGLKQMRLAESEKERMVTFYFNGMNDDPFKGEERDIVASPKVETYDKKPEMSVGKIVSRFKRYIGRNKYQLFVMNFANPDMVSHSGNIKATVNAIELVDKEIGEVVKTTLSKDGIVLITADHGNAEELLSYPTKSFFVTTETGTVNTEHSNNPVPIYIIGKTLSGNNLGGIRGSLADVAPTILYLMGRSIPSEMKGKNLLKKN